MKKRIWYLGLFLILVSLGTYSSAKTRKLQVIQQKSFVRWHRGELTLSFAGCLNEVLTKHYGLSVIGRFHILPYLAVRAEYVKYFGGLSDTAKSLGNNFAVYPEKRILDYFTGVGVEYTPIIGKFLTLERFPLMWDLHLFALLGITRNTHDLYHFTPALGIGVRVGILQWLALNVEAGDYIYRESFSKEKDFMNNFQAMIGFSIMIPPVYHYKYEK